MKFISIILAPLVILHVQGLLTDTSTARHFLKAATQLGVKTPLSPKATIPTNMNGNVSVQKDLERQAPKYSKWGVDNAYDDEYWFNDSIHTLGNTGLGGALHAALAPLSTKLIDNLAYQGTDIRQQVASELFQLVEKTEARVVDLCCGVGISTRALQASFPAGTVTGLDSSPEMVAMAKFLEKYLTVVKPWLGNTLQVLLRQGQKLSASACNHTPIQFLQGNAEDTHLPSKSVDLVTIMYAFHEAPRQGRANMLREARRILSPGGTLAVVDIASDYLPSKQMLAGEPYVLEYQQSIHQQLRSFEGLVQQEYKVLVPGHVGMWILKRAPRFLSP